MANNQKDIIKVEDPVNVNQDDFVTVFNPATQQTMRVKRTSPLVTRKEQPLQIVPEATPLTPQQLQEERIKVAQRLGQPTEIVIPDIDPRAAAGSTLKVRLGDPKIAEAFRQATGKDLPPGLSPAQVQDILNKSITDRSAAEAAAPAQVPGAQTQQQASLFQKASQTIARELDPEGNMTQNAIIAQSLENIRQRANVQAQRRISNAKQTAQAINQVLDEDLENMKQITQRNVESIDASSTRRRQLLEKSKEAAVGKLELEKERFDNEYANLVAEAEEKEEERRIKAETANGLLGTFGSSAANQNLRTEAQRGQRLIFNLKQARIIGGKNFAIDIAETIEKFAEQIDNLERARQESKQAAYDNLLAKTSEIRKNRILTEADKNKQIDDAIAQFDKVNFEVDLRISDDLKEQVAAKVRLAQDLIEKDIEMTRDQQKQTFELLKKGFEQEFELTKLGITEARKREEFAVTEERLRADTQSRIFDRELKAVREGALAESLIKNREVSNLVKQLEQARAEELQPLKIAELQAKITKARRTASGSGFGFGTISKTFSEQTGVITDSKGRPFIDRGTGQPVPYRSNELAKQAIEAAERKNEIFNDAVKTGTRENSLLAEQDIQAFVNQVVSRGGDLPTVIDSLKASPEIIVDIDDQNVAKIYDSDLIFDDLLAEIDLTTRELKVFQVGE